MIKWLTVGFAAILLLIITCATFGWAEPVFAFVRRVPGSDKVAHFLLLGTMSLLLNLSLGCHRTNVAGMAFLTGVFMLLVLATIEEFVQIWVPTRSFSLGDLACNYLGIVLFGWLAARIHGRGQDASETNSLS